MGRFRKQDLPKHLWRQWKQNTSHWFQEESSGILLGNKDAHKDKNWLPGPFWLCFLLNVSPPSWPFPGSMDSHITLRIFFLFAASQAQHYQEDLARSTHLGKDWRIPDPEILNHHFRLIIFGDHKKVELFCSLNYLNFLCCGFHT